MLHICKRLPTSEEGDDRPIGEQHQPQLMKVLMVMKVGVGVMVVAVGDGLLLVLLGYDGAVPSVVGCGCTAKM